MASVSLLPEAVEDLARLDAFLRPKSTKAADRFSRLLENALHRLKRFPKLGSLIEDHPGFRELHVQFGAAGYSLRYRLVEQEVVVVRVWHSREGRH